MSCIEISIADNGYVLEYDDPDVQAKNRGPSSAPWVDPTSKRVYDTPEALCADLLKMLPIMKDSGGAVDSAQDFQSSIKQAFSEADDD